MKRIATFGLILLLVLATLCASGFASAATDVDRKVEVAGYIGLSPGTDPSTVISITYPAKVEWSVTEDTAPNVMSPPYTIENNSTMVDLRVKLKSFTQTNAAQVPITNLKLNLTGALNADGIGDDIVGFQNTSNAPYSDRLIRGREWIFGFDGEYTGPIPAVALEPAYDMNLNFALAD